MAIKTDLILDGDGAWPDMLNAREGTLEAVARLKGGMQSGEASVGFRIKMENGELIFVQTSVRMFLMLARGLRAKEEMEGTRDLP